MKDSISLLFICILRILDFVTPTDQIVVKQRSFTIAYSVLTLSILLFSLIGFVIIQ